MTLHEYCQDKINIGWFDITLSKQDFIKKCKGLGIFGGGYMGFSDGYNLAGVNGDFCLEGEREGNERPILFKGSWSQLYDYLIKEFNTEDEEQITFW